MAKEKKEKKPSKFGNFMKGLFTDWSWKGIGKKALVAVGLYGAAVLGSLAVALIPSVAVSMVFGYALTGLAGLFGVSAVGGAVVKPVVSGVKALANLIKNRKTAKTDKTKKDVKEKKVVKTPEQLKKEEEERLAAEEAERAAAEKAAKATLEEPIVAADTISVKPVVAAPAKTKKTSAKAGGTYDSMSPENQAFYDNCCYKKNDAAFRTTVAKMTNEQADYVTGLYAAKQQEILSTKKPEEYTEADIVVLAIAKKLSNIRLYDTQDRDDHYNDNAAAEEALGKVAKKMLKKSTK